MASKGSQHEAKHLDGIVTCFRAWAPVAHDKPTHGWFCKCFEGVAHSTTGGDDGAITTKMVFQKGVFVSYESDESSGP